MGEFHGEFLEAVDFSVGGIGAGCIRMNGNAMRHAWHIFGNIAPVSMQHSFFAVRAQVGAGSPVARVLQTVAKGPFGAMADLVLRGEYPFASYHFQEPGLPVKVTMEAFNPLIPTDVKNSAIPCAVYHLTARNTSKKRATVAFLAAQRNAVGCPEYGANINRIVQTKSATTLHMTAPRPKDDTRRGDMALVAFENGTAAAQAGWEDLDALYGKFMESGCLDGAAIAGPSRAGRTVDGALTVPFSLAPGEARTVTFGLVWHFPNSRHGDADPGQGYYVRLKASDANTDYSVRRGWGGMGNMYANWWTDALDVARYLENHLVALTKLTRQYRDTLYASNLPGPVLDRISSQVAVLRSPTCFWTKDGYFGGWEG